LTLQPAVRTKTTAALKGHLRRIISLPYDRETY
jgi:hypothetical protein